MQIGRTLILVGLGLVLLGGLVLLSERTPFKLGRLPLDFHWQRGNTSFYFPLGTSVVVSLLLSGLLWLLQRRG